MTLEAAITKAPGLALQVQPWPKARHYILRVWRVESRVIVENGRPGRILPVALLLAAGLFLAISNN